MTPRLRARRREMVRQQLVARGIADLRVLQAMALVPREEFVPSHMVEYAYEDGPLPIGEGQTISQPYMVALMAEALELRPTDIVLEVGTGSGYAAAILAHLASQVYSVERMATLAREVPERLRRLGIANVHVLHGDGSVGWSEHAPYDGIVVAAGGPVVPEALVNQLAQGGRLVIPVGPSTGAQRLLRVRRVAPDRVAEESLGEVRFVPLIGREGWDGSTDHVDQAQDA